VFIKEKKEWVGSRNTVYSFIDFATLFFFLFARYLSHLVRS